MTDTIDTMIAHRTVRKFTDEVLERDVIEKAVRAAQFASTSSNVQAYSCLWVRDTAKRAALVELTGGQPQVAQAGAFFVISGDQRRHRAVARRADSTYSANLETFLLCAVDAALFAQNLVLAFESLGYGICYIGGLREALPKVDQLLEVPAYVFPFYGLCVGRPADDPGQRPRLPLDAVLLEDCFPSASEVEEQVERYDSVMREYYSARGSSGHNWSGGIVAKFRDARRSELAEYYRSKGARLE